MIGVTVVLITCSYNDAEFVRVGYYVNNEYDCEELRLNPPEATLPERITRTILADKPRVTRFPIKWDDILDETAKKAEDEALDRDADAIDNDGNRMMMSDAFENEEDGDDDEEDEGSEDVDESCEEDDENVEDEEDADEFTSQLGPEEQDRMGMMIDGDDDENDISKSLTDPYQQHNIPFNNGFDGKSTMPFSASQQYHQTTHLM